MPRNAKTAHTDKKGDLAVSTAHCGEQSLNCQFRPHCSMRQLSDAVYRCSIWCNPVTSYTAAQEQFLIKLLGNFAEEIWAEGHFSLQ